MTAQQPALVVLTRPEGRNQQLHDALQKCGLRCAVIPALDINSIKFFDPSAHASSNFDLIVFVSTRAVHEYMHALAEHGLAWSPQCAAGAVGTATAHALRCSPYGEQLQVIAPPVDDPNQDSEALWQALEPRLATVKRVLIVRGEQGREWLSEHLRTYNIAVTRVAAYRREPARWSEQAAQQIQQATAVQGVVCLLSSSESVVAILDNLQRILKDNCWAKLRYVAIHQRIADRLQSECMQRGLLVPQTVLLSSPNVDSMCDALLLAAKAS